MFYPKRRVIFVMIVCCMVIQLGQAYKNSCEVVGPVEVVQIPTEGVTDTKGTNIQEALPAHEESEAAQEVYGNKESEHEKILAEADKVIADAEELLNQHDGMEAQKTEKTSDKALKEHIILAARGGYIRNKTDVKVPIYNLSDVEFKLMAKVVEAEAGGEPYEGQVAVANVIFNRVKAGWAATVTEVINQKGQFTKRRKEPSISVTEAINEALYGRNAVPEGTLFFQNLNTSTSFRIPNTKQYVTKIGRHTFYK